MTKVTATKRIVTVPEMIEAIKEHYNLNDTLLAINLKVTNQTIKAWKEGKKPRKDSYLALTELYEGISEEIHNERIEETTEETQEITEEKKPYEISYPKNGEQIYYLSRFTGRVQDWIFDIDDEDDKHLYDTGLYFDTEEEAEQFKRERALIKKIKCWTKEQQGDWQPDWSGLSTKYLMDIKRSEREIYLRQTFDFDMMPKLPYFKSEEIAQACINEFGDEILEVFC